MHALQTFFWILYHNMAKKLMPSIAQKTYLPIRWTSRSIFSCKQQRTVLTTNHNKVAVSQPIMWINHIVWQMLSYWTLVVQQIINACIN